MEKVWIFNHYASDMYINKGGRHYWFSENLKKLGFKPTIFCANTLHNKTEVIPTETFNYSIKFLNEIPFVFVRTTLATENGVDRILNMVTFFKNIFGVAKKIAEKSGKPDIIIASSVHPLTMVAGIKIAKKMNIPCVCEIRDLWPEAIFKFKKVKEKSVLGRILTRGEQWIYKNADALIFTKEGDVDYIFEKKWDRDSGGDIDIEKIHYINNGVELEVFNAQTLTNQLEDPDLVNNMFKVIYVGAVRPVNNVQNIIEAAIELKEQKDITFLIYGDGNQKANLEKMVLEHNLTNVKIKGFVNKKYIPYILSKSSVNLLNYSTTDYNWSRGNSSNKLFEYMASGKPIISSVKMGYSIINKYKCGVELETGKPIEMAKMILKIKNMEKESYERMGNNGKEGAKDFDFRFLTERLVEVMKSTRI